MKINEASNTIHQALVCRPGKNFSEGTLSTVGIPNHERALAQHQAYCDALQKCGVDVTVLQGDTFSPDGCFINSMAVVTEYLAVIGNSSNDGLKSAEQKDVAAALAGSRFLKFITSPGRLHCGDVLQLNNHFYISLSEQTNQEGAAQLAFFLAESGYKVTMLAIDQERPVRLGTAVAYLGHNRILIREELARHFSFLEYDQVIVPYKERGAANALLVNGTLVMPAGYSETLKKIRQLDIPVVEVNMSEFEKLNGGLSCLSLRISKAANSSGITLPTKRQVAA